MIFFKNEKMTDEVIKIIALEDEIDCGYCLLKIKDNSSEVYELNYQKDKPYLVEGLLRSAFNYACLKGVYMGKCSCENLEDFLEKMNFQKTENGYENDIPSILTGSCCK